MLNKIFIKNLYLSFIQVPVTMKNQNLRPKIIKKSQKIYKVRKSNVLNAYRNMLILVHLKKKFCSSSFGC